MASSQSNSGQWIKFLRPLLWWGILVLGAVAYVEHKRMMERTVVKFAIEMPWQTFNSDAVVTLDGQPVTSGQRISLGNHTLTVAEPKAEPFRADFFAWYGGRDFGQIALKRTMGSLNVVARPAAQRLTISGPEVSMTLYDSGGTNLAVPSDLYTIRAEYSHWSQTQSATVMANQTAPCTFAPQFGGIKLTCNRAGATFELRYKNQQVTGKGDFPRVFMDLPAGDFVLTATHDQHIVSLQITVQAGVTNEIPVAFQYGAATVMSTPVGATVADGDGKVLGVTPLHLMELAPGDLRLSVQLSGYEPASTLLKIADGQTSLFQTNLISQGYTRAMSEARKYWAVTNYDLASQAINQALQLSPGDEIATALQQEVNVGFHFQQAANFEVQSNFTAAISEYKAVLAIRPDNDQAKQLLAQGQKNQPEQLERERLERLNRPQMEFDTWMLAERDSSLFDSHELKTSKSFKDVHDAVRKALASGQPAFRITRDNCPNPELCNFEAEQELMTYMNTSAGKRRCVVVFGQTKDDEIKILFKVFENKTEAVNKFSIGSLIGTPVAVNYVSLAFSRAELTDDQKKRIAEGVQLVTDRIQQAIGQP